MKTKMEQKKTFVVYLVVALLLGGLLTFGFFPRVVEVETEVEVFVDKIVEVNVTEYVPQYVEVVVYENEILLDTSVNELLEYLNDEDLLMDYNLDEVSLSKVYEYSLTYDKKDVTFEGEVKLKFKESGEQSEKERFEFSVFYEDNEEAVVTLIE